MKIVLAALAAKYIHTNPALYSLKACAPAFADRIEVCEFTINQRREDILKMLYRKKPDILAFSCYIWNVDMILSIVGVMKMVSPGTAIWLGGPEVSADGAGLLEAHPCLSGVMAGEGERTFRQVLEAYGNAPANEALRDEALSAIPGICWRDAGGKVRKTRPQERQDLIPMDELPFLYERLSAVENRIIYYETSRGCPFSCSYCLSATDRGLRLRSLGLVKRELQHFLEGNVRQVKFVDRTFNADHEHAMAIWRYLKEHDNGVTNFHFEIEANLLREDEVRLLSSLRPGLVKLELGVQSTNPRTLRAVHRNPRVDQIGHWTRLLREGRGIHLHLDLIAGLPYEDYESFRASFDQVYAMGPDELQLGFLKLLKGSPLWQEAKRYGILCQKEAPYEVLGTAWLSYEEILRLKDVEEMLEIYHNSHQFDGAIKALEVCFDGAMALYEALADWYEAHEERGASLTRARRLEVLRQFGHRVLRQRGGGPKEELDFDQHLLEDLYLRENALTRPSWAPDLGEPQYREPIRSFYRQEARSRRYLPGLCGYDARQLARMCHLEPKRTLLPEGERITGWLLFDYSRRDKVTGNAFCRQVSEGAGTGTEESLKKK